uniref:hypothetical protein n=1 Tax=Klebsiella pneumoniae TaxID=573 RepID=UPI000AA46E9B|nr:hypothetical protein [Klebsiella pneumoniae]
MPYSAGVHPIAIGKSVQKTGLPYNNSLYPNCPHKALINRGSITFWLDDEAIQAWYGFVE